MALEGLLGEFGLADILQLIYFQKKTGVLNIESKIDKVKIFFVNGNITTLESQRKLESNRLGRILIKKGLLWQTDLDSVMKIQKDEGVRLGNILVREGLVPKEVLMEVIQGQITESISQIISWKQGKYGFVPREVPIDKELSISLDTQHLLMDGLRVVDEWSTIEEKLDINTVFKRADVTEPAQLDSLEEHILSLVDGESDVGTLISASDLEELETSKALISLAERGLIVPTVIRPVEEDKIPEKKLTMPFYIIIFFVVIIVSFSIVSSNLDAFTAFKEARIGAKIKRIKTEIDIYRFNNGKYPQNLKDVTTEKDPWKREYVYKVAKDGFTLFSLGADGIEGTEDDIY